MNNSKLVKDGEEKLIEWLKQPNQLSNSPYKIQYVNELNFDNSDYCLIYKFKPTRFGKWLFGISSNYGEISSMDLYNEKDNQHKAKILFNVLKKFKVNNLETIEDNIIKDQSAIISILHSIDSFKQKEIIYYNCVSGKKFKIYGCKIIIKSITNIYIDFIIKIPAPFEKYKIYKREYRLKKGEKEKISVPYGEMMRPANYITIKFIDNSYVPPFYL